ncbi:hypothetical protein [Aequorivita viscosa]|uniref:PEP-CTERM protein-sorting domain-containing protein n=1 Tax=Aequorivita viscosa TaxID=797419 RepID=A0A1M6GSC5_9FLAO|nr:hypothetical protein [Aequorivita viscosa]SDW77994.1 hypothetical protein SAMN05216556_11017 [Aequorivita viscosa]SHJ12850.1 hypothetical protein SAMN04487908_1101 [Aequorivita viscosa]
MRTEKRFINRKAVLLFTGLLIVGSLTANAQIGLPGGDPNIPDAPIDGFLSIGLIAGACIGLRKKIKGLKN